MPGEAFPEPALPPCDGCSLTDALRKLGFDAIAGEYQLACSEGRQTIEKAGLPQPECAGPVGVAGEGDRKPQSAAYRLGQRLRDARLARNLQQGQLTDAGFSESYLRAIEDGTVRPSLTALIKLADQLGVPLDKLLGGDQTKQPGSDGTNLSDEENE
jgi:ribosome-binding protein aMBF1 (putative translation factor)